MKLRSICEAYSVDELEHQLTLPYVPDIRHRTEPNKINRGALHAAVSYHAKNFKGKRWPALEKAFLSRANTYRGTGGCYVRPRTLLYAYLNNLSEPWPEGEEMADTALKATQRADSNYKYNENIDFLRNSKDAQWYAIRNQAKNGLFDVDYRPSELTPEDHYT